MLYSIKRFVLVGCVALALLPLLVVPPATPSAPLGVKKHYLSLSVADASHR